MSEQPTALDPILQASYDAAMAVNESEWCTTKDPLVLIEVIDRADLYRQPIPTWAVAPVRQLIHASRTDHRARRHRESVLHMLRYETVQYLQAGGMTLEEAFEHVAQTSPIGCDAEMLEKSYYKVLHDLEAGRGSKYYKVKGAALAPKL